MTNQDDPLGSDMYELPSELRSSAMELGWALARSLEVVSGKYLVQRQEAALLFKDQEQLVEVSSAEIARFLNQLRPMAMDSIDPPKQDLRIRFGGPLGSNLLRFIELFLVELRGIICKGAKSVSGTTHTVIVALSSWLASKIGVQPHIATAVATAILVAVLTATKGSFCKMTDAHAKAALAAAAMPRARR